MKGWAVVAGVLAGAAVQQQQAQLVAGAVATWAVLCVAVVVAVVVVVVAVAAAPTVVAQPVSARPESARPGSRGRGWTAAGIFVLVAAAAWAATELRAAHRLSKVLAADLEGQDLWLTGTIDSLPDVELQGVRFVLRVQSAAWRGEPVAVPPRVRLSWWRGAEGARLWQGPPVPLHAGQHWRLPVRLKRPHGLANPHGFDVERWLFEQGIGATGSVRAGVAAPATLLAPPGGLAVDPWRQALRDRLFSRVADPARAGVLAALMVGDQAAIERGDWQVFQATGVAHLMSISGLHVTMWAWLAGLLIRAAWRRQTGWHRWAPAPQAGRIGGLLAATAYALLAGWGVPAQRTVVMLAVVVLLRHGAWRWPALHVMGAAAAVVAVLDPWALAQPGFWLSFVAVALLMASDPASGVASGRSWDRLGVPAGRAPARCLALAAGVWRIVRDGLKAQAIATVGLAPLTLMFFQQISLVGFLANLLAVPVVTLLITPLVMAGALVPPLWSLADAVLAGLMAALRTIAAWPMALWHVPAAPAWALATGLVGGALAVMPLPWRLRLLAVPLLLPLLWPAMAQPAAGQFEVVAVDVGQGTAVLVRTRHHLLVYDAGPAWGPGSDAGSRVLLPLLRARGERHIDVLMLSHRDTDHTGGAASMLAGLPVRALHSSLEPEHALRAVAASRLLPHVRCDAGQAWHWGGVDFEVLHPPPGRLDRAAGPARPNAVSCVLRVRSPQGSLLLTGDIEAAQEAALVQALGPALRSDVLLVPHHGSRTSSTDAFLDAVAPRVAVVQAGYRSRYGHPSPVVMRRYGARGIEVVRSDTCGAWTWRAGESAGSGACTRGEGRRYWHHRSGP